MIYRDTYWPRFEVHSATILRFYLSKDVDRDTKEALTRIINVGIEERNEDITEQGGQKNQLNLKVTIGQTTGKEQSDVNIEELRNRTAKIFNKIRNMLSAIDLYSSADPE